MEASRFQKSGSSYIADDDSKSDKWAWVFFETEAEIPWSAEIVAKAVCFLFPLFSYKEVVQNFVCQIYLFCNHQISKFGVNIILKNLTTRN